MSNVLVADHWSELDLTNWAWSNFTPEELACQETHSLKVDVVALNRLQALRSAYGKPIALSSAYRSPQHSKEARKSKPGMHTSGKAFDIRCAGDEALILLRLALDVGFSAIGVSQKGAWSERFIHVDTRDVPAFWSY